MWILYIREGINGNDRVLIDPHELSPDHTTNISIKDISGDGKLLLYGLRKSGEDETDIRLMNISSRKDLLEYGDASNPDHFDFLYKYSPYQNIRKGTDYPAVLFTTGDADTRVPPLQARKMTARLQYAAISDRPIILLYDTKAGHSGGKHMVNGLKTPPLKWVFSCGS